MDTSAREAEQYYGLLRRCFPSATSIKSVKNGVCSEVSAVSVVFRSNHTQTPNDPSFLLFTSFRVGFLEMLHFLTLHLILR